MFQNLEFTTENMWHDFVNQYKLASQRHTKNLADKAKHDQINVDSGNGEEEEDSD
jgi:hypothetical protein